MTLLIIKVEVVNSDFFYKALFIVIKLLRPIEKLVNPPHWHTIEN